MSALHTSSSACRRVAGTAQSLSLIQLLATPWAVGASVHGISQARKLEWLAISSSRGSSWPGDQTCISCVFCLRRQILYHWATWETNSYSINIKTTTKKKKKRKKGSREKRKEITKGIGLPLKRILGIPRPVWWFYLTSPAGHWSFTFSNQLWR